MIGVGGHDERGRVARFSSRGMVRSPSRMCRQVCFRCRLIFVLVFFIACLWSDDMGAARGLWPRQTRSRRVQQQRARRKSLRLLSLAVGHVSRVTRRRWRRCAARERRAASATRCIGQRCFDQASTDRGRDTTARRQRVRTGRRSTRSASLARRLDEHAAARLVPSAGV